MAKRQLSENGGEWYNKNVDSDWDVLINATACFQEEGIQLLFVLLLSFIRDLGEEHVLDEVGGSAYSLHYMYIRK